MNLRLESQKELICYLQMGLKSQNGDNKVGRLRAIHDSEVSLLLPMTRPTSLYRIPFMALSLIILFFATWAGLVRLGWALPALPRSVTYTHGALMIGGFLGTLISLERAVALRQRWTYLAPLFSGAGAVLLLVGNSTVGAGFITAGSVGLGLIFVAILRRETALYTVTMTLGTLIWLGGNLLWLMGRPIFALIPWWGGFLLLTIVGERLELSRVMRPPHQAHLAFGGAVSLLLAGILLSVVRLDIGMRVMGVGMVAVVVWLLRYDVTRRTIRQQGMVRYIAVCMMGGYLWLAVSGVLALVYGGVPAGPLYDAIVHSLFLGFVFSMIFGHALLIIPAVVGIGVPYHSIFYSHLLLLHLSLMVRVAGDLGGWVWVRQWGGLFNGVALLLFLVNTVRAVRAPS